MGFLSSLLSFFPKSSASNVISDGESRWWGSGSTWAATNTGAGEDVNQDSLMRSATCYACTKALSETVAGLPGHTFETHVEKNVRANTEEFGEARELLVDRANPEMDAFIFREMMVSRLVNRGNFFAEIERDKYGAPVALWPIHNSRVEPMRDNEGSLFYQISNNYAGSPRYDDPSWRDANLHYLTQHNMLNVVGFGSQNGIMAPGMLPGAEEIAMDFAARRYGGNFFASGATPSGMVTHPGYIENEPKRNQFRDDLNRVHNNKTGAGKIGVLWQGATYNQISVTPEQAQFLETRKFTSEQICKFYGVQPAIIGDYENSKFATADSMIRVFVMTCLRNLVIRIETAIDGQVLRRREEGKLKKAFKRNLIYKLALDGLLRGDPQTQASVAKTLRDGGALSTNEMRAQFDYNPVEGPEGDYRIVPGGYARLDKITDQGAKAESKSPVNAVAEHLAANAKANLIEGLKQVVSQDSPVTVYGYDPREEVAEKVADKITDKLVGVFATSAADRIDKITDTQVARWREQDPKEVAGKLTEFWAKQSGRLREALSPLDAIQEGVSDSVCEAYLAHNSKFDNYSIFNHAKLDIAAEVRKCFS